MKRLKFVVIGIVMYWPAVSQTTLSQTTVTTTKDGSTVTSTVALAPGSLAGNENYILRIHVDGRASYFRYTFHYTLNDAPGTNHQTKGYRDGFVTRADDQNGNTEVFIPTHGKLKECTIYVIESAAERLPAVAPQSVLVVPGAPAITPPTIPSTTAPVGQGANTRETADAGVNALGLSKLTIQQARERVLELDKNIANVLAEMPLPPRDQFESIADYNHRKQAWLDQAEQRVHPWHSEMEQFKKELYLDPTMKPVFLSYDADAQELTASIAGGSGSCRFKIPRASAKQMQDSWSGVSVARTVDVTSSSVLPGNPAVPIAAALVSKDHVYVMSSGSGTSSPSVISRVDPEYSKDADRAKLSGTVLLSIVVDTDGKADDIRVVKSLGMGLDEKAIEAVSKWRFTPGRKQCIPARVRAQIEVNFRKL